MEQKLNGTIIVDRLPPSVNHCYISVVKGRRVIKFPSKEFKEYKQYLAIKAAYTATPLLSKEKLLSLDITYTVGDRRRHDLDNFLKVTFDSLTGVLCEDDNQVVVLSARKVYIPGKQEMTIKWSVQQ